MPPPPPLVDVAEWRLSGNVRNVTSWHVGFHLFLPPDPTADDSDLELVHQDLVTAFLFFWGVIASSECFLGLSRIRVLGSAGLLEDEDRPRVPGSSGFADAAHVAAGFTWHTFETGRGRFGRTFMPAVAKDASTVGALWNDPPASTWQTHANTFLAQVNSISRPRFPTCQLVLLHRRLHGAWLPAATIAPIRSVKLQPRIASDVRRLKTAVGV